MRKLFMAVVVVSSFVAGGVAQAQAQPRGASRTHDGFFLQMDLGFGGMTSTADSINGELELSGPAGVFSLSLGGALTPNFILAGQLWGISAASPDAKIGGVDANFQDLTLGLSGVGVNLTYYFMPVNVYVSVTPSLGTISVEDAGGELETDSGFAIKLAVGKEWWVSDNWGLGLNLQYAHSSNDVTDTDSSFATNWFGVAFSATYN